MRVRCGKLSVGVVLRDLEGLVCSENLNADVVMMKSAEYRVWTYDSSPLNRARDRRIFIQ
jgi:hypothetical protein